VQEERSEQLLADRRILQRVVRQDPLLTVGDFAFVAGMLAIAVVFSVIGIAGIARHESTRLVVISLFSLSLALAGAYVAVAALTLWLIEWLRPNRGTEE
jgi:hypothetical protein